MPVDNRVHQLLQNIFQFKESEYEQFRHILELESVTSEFLEYVRQRFMSVHYSSVKDFVEKYLGEYNSVEVSHFPGESRLVYISRNITTGIVGHGIAISRDRIEHLRMHKQNGEVVAGVLLSTPLSFARKE